MGEGALEGWDDAEFIGRASRIRLVERLFRKKSFCTAAV